MEQTLSIIKPDATERNIIGAINAMLEAAGLVIVAQKMIHMTKQEAQLFYAEHKERSFYDELCEYMSSGPVVVQVLAGEDAIIKNREVIGATNPASASEGTVRRTYGLDIERNSVHGSDNPNSAAREIAFFFSQTEIVR